MRTTITTPIGELTLAASSRGLTHVVFPGGVCTDDEPDSPQAAAHLAAAARQLGEYFDGQRDAFELSLDAPGTEFQRAAWAALRTIPFGETVTYGEQAARLGDKGKARAVGAANGRNPLPIVVPCHRVVGSNGTLTGFAGGVATKAWLLDHERAVRAR